MLAEIRVMEERGIRDVGYALKMLRKKFPPPDHRLRMRDEPVPLALAIHATCEADEHNISAARRQMNDLLRVPVVTRGALMPDACPAGKETAAIPVGGIIEARRAIIPSAHSEDLCCSMHASFFQTEANVPEILDALETVTRFGPGGRERETWVRHPVLDEPVWDNPFLKGLERHAAMHLADQGDGNHFAWLGEMEMTEVISRSLVENGHDDLARALEGGARWKTLVTHHGSRGLGAHVFKRGKKAAEKHTQAVARGIPAAGHWLDADTPEGIAYWEALQYVARWTLANHRCIHGGLAAKLGCRITAETGNAHNFVWREGDGFFHGKGATPAGCDENGRPLLGLIPLNMAAPILLVCGKNNGDFLGFAPHGAGRNVSRRAMVRTLEKEHGTLDEAAIRRHAARQTTGLDVRWWHGKPDLAETPMAYKSAQQIREQIERFQLAKILAEIQPLGCIMAGDAGPRSREKELTPKQIRQIAHRADRRTNKQRMGQEED